MSTYVLVHGSWHGGWCWYKTVARLEAAGHEVVAPDLPALGRDRTPIADVTLELWADRVCQVLDAQKEPVVLVGHSRGGIVISRAAEKRPDKVRCLVYLAAFLLGNGESLLEVAQSDGDSDVLPNLEMFEEQGYATVKPEAIRKLFYGDCSDEDVALARLCLVPEPLAPLATPLELSDAKFGRIPRVYIECLKDNAIPPALQKRMYTALECRSVITMDTAHSPFFSAPDELAGHLLAI